MMGAPFAPADAAPPLGRVSAWLLFQPGVGWRSPGRKTGVIYTAEWRLPGYTAEQVAAICTQEPSLHVYALRADGRVTLADAAPRQRRRAA